VAASDSQIELKFFKPEDNGGAEIMIYELFRNDGDSQTAPSIKVDSYNTNLLTHTLTVADDSITSGLIYKFVFRTTNAVGNSLESNIVEYAICDVPLAPGSPVVMLAHTSDTTISVDWPAVVSLNAPGSDVTGYALEIKDTRDMYGTYEVVFDGSELYPDWRNFQLSDERVVNGNNYIFRVRAKYQNGFTAYSTESLPVWACLPPRNLDQILLTAVDQTSMSFKWAQPQFTGACNLHGFALLMNDGQGGDTFTEIDSTEIRN
jgi:hypothetical protein